MFEKYPQWQAPSAGPYLLNLRIANLAGINPKFRIYSKGSEIAFQEVASTGNADNWESRSIPVTLPAGNQTLRISSAGASGCKMLWISLTDITDIRETQNCDYEVFVDNNNQLQIVSSGDISIGAIYDFSGNILFQGKPVKKTDLSSFGNGIYILKLIFENGKQTTTKFTINK